MTLSAMTLKLQILSPVCTWVQGEISTIILFFILHDESKSRVILYLPLPSPDGRQRGKCLTQDHKLMR